MMHGWYGPGWNMGDYWWIGLLGMILQLLFWGGIIYLAYRLIKGMSRPQFEGRSSDNCINILKERYARGEIDLEEYNTRKRELER